MFVNGVFPARLVSMNVASAKSLLVGEAPRHSKDFEENTWFNKGSRLLTEYKNRVLAVLCAPMHEKTTTCMEASMVEIYDNIPKEFSHLGDTRINEIPLWKMSRLLASKSLLETSSVQEWKIHAWTSLETDGVCSK
mgnify:CR=1 FL=1